MAFGQTDPARLEGDALRQWYLRSPADIEDEKRQAAARAYDAFFSQPDDSQSDDSAGAPTTPTTPPQDAASDGALTWRQVGPNRFRSERASPDSMPASDSDSGGFQLAAATFPAWGRWPINGCVNCHNPQTGDLLPGSSPSPRPPMFSPRLGGAGGSKSDKPQCEQQSELDREVCARIGDFRCWENLNKRYAHCLRYDREVGTPALKFGGR